MTTHSLVLGFTAETAMHAGASTSNHVIDLPIMREHNTGWPVVFGSAVKGALRAKAEMNELAKETLFTLFGPDTNNASDHAGSLMIGDARLLLLPVRSLTSQYRYVTSPDLLARWQRDAARAGVQLPEFSIPQPADNVALVSDACKTKDLFLEEFVFSTDGTVISAELLSALARVSGRSEQEIAQKITIVSDDQFSILCRSAIPVNAHIAIDNATKTVKRGALWYEESLPADTVLYSVIGAQKSRNTEQPLSAGEVLALFNAELIQPRTYLQLGGNETTGMGWCKVQVVQGGAV